MSEKSYSIMDNKFRIYDSELNYETAKQSIEKLKKENPNLSFSIIEEV